MRITKSGIYKICGPDQHIYIGSAQNLANRLYNHKYALKRNMHTNLHLQHAWNKYGEDSFRFQVIERIEDTELLQEKEQYYLNQILEIFSREKVYNICEKAFRPSKSFGRDRNRLHDHFFFSIKEKQIITIKDLPLFCKEQRISYTSMVGVSCGYKKSYKNYVNISVYNNKEFAQKGRSRWRMSEIEDVARNIYQKHPHISCRSLVKELVIQSGHKISPTTAATYINKFKGRAEDVTLL